MPEAAVVNASPLIVLSRAGHLELLQQLCDRIMVPTSVIEEVTVHSDEAASALQQHAWLHKVSPEQTDAAVTAWDLGAGESAVLSWAVAHPGTIAVLDDHAARTCAQVLGVRVIGTLGLALRSKASGRIPAARPVVEKLRQAGLYLSDAVIEDALALVGE